MGGGVASQSINKHREEAQHTVVTLRMSKCWTCVEPHSVESQICEIYDVDVFYNFKGRRVLTQHIIFNHMNDKWAVFAHCIWALLTSGVHKLHVEFGIWNLFLKYKKSEIISYLNHEKQILIGSGWKQKLRLTFLLPVVTNAAGRL